MNLFPSKYLVWFSCGAASACAAKIAVDRFKDLEIEVLYCDTLKYEHPDNLRFMRDVEQWIGQEIKILKSTEYTDIYDVFEKTKFLKGPRGARCTTEMKKKVRFAYQAADDIHVFGFTVEESGRIARFYKENPELYARMPLSENGITKQGCFDMLTEAKIELPAMYRLGYKNNNCIGCVKGGKGYWNKIRADFPEMFDRMAQQERRLNFALNTITENGIARKIFLDELPPNVGRYETEADIECGVLCITAEESK